MAIPRVLRDQAKFYASKGFHIIDAEPRVGAHFLVRFAEFPERQILTKNAGDPRAMLNNVSVYRRLKEKANGTDA
jgi:hypothetical protein